MEKGHRRNDSELFQACWIYSQWRTFCFEEDTTSIILKDSLSQQHYPNTDLDKYLEADYHLYTTEVATEDSIVHDILGDNTLTDDSDDEIIDVIHEVKPTR